MDSSFNRVQSWNYSYRTVKVQRASRLTVNATPEPVTKGKTVTTSSTGTLKTTVQASADGYYRHSFAGASTTPAANSSGDLVDVR